MAGRQLVLTASQVESFLDNDTELVFSGSDDDLDAVLDEDLDRQQGDQSKTCMHNIVVEIINR